MTSTPPVVDHTPRRDKKAFNCPRCGAYAEQIWRDLGTGTDSKALFNLVETAPGVILPDLWKRSICQVCKLPSIWRDHEMIYPRRIGPIPNSDMPKEIKEIFEEAASVSVISRRAGAALARATIERLIKHLDPDASKAANLAVRIDRIKPQVSTALGQMLDVVRVTGNEALHNSENPGDLIIMTLDDNEGPNLIEYFLTTANDLVDELLTKPKQASQLWSKIPVKIQEAINKTSQQNINLGT